MIQGSFFGIQCCNDSLSLYFDEPVLDTKLRSLYHKTPKTDKIVRKVCLYNWWFIDDLIGKNLKGHLLERGRLLE